MHKVPVMIKSMRVPEWRAYFALAIYGYLYISRFNISVEELGRLAISMSVYMAVTYIINNFYDIESDKLNINKKLRNPMIENNLDSKTVLITVVLLILPGLIIMPNLLALVNYSVMCLLSLFYSAPPVRLKEKPPLDLLSHALFFGVQPFLQGALTVSNPSHSFAIEVIVLIGLYSTFLQLRNEWEDYSSDLLAGYKTTAVIMGLNTVEKFLKIMAIIIIIIGIIILNYVISNIKLEWLIILFATFLLFKDYIIKYKFRILDIFVIIIFIVILLS